MALLAESHTLAWLVLLCRRMNTATPIVPPLAPAVPDGPSSGLVRTVYRFTASSSDPLGHGVKCRFYWGDGTMSDWTVPGPGGAPHTLAHVWTKPGRYTVCAQAKNTAGVQSSWGPALLVKIEENGAGKNRREGPAERVG